jgi:hypothetical protein
MAKERKRVDMIAIIARVFFATQDDLAVDAANVGHEGARAR